MYRLLLALPLLAACKGYPDPVEVRHCDGGPYDSTMSALCKDTETPRERPAAPVEPPEVVEVPEAPDDQWGPC